MLSARVRDNPLLGLIWLESFGLVAAYITDVGLSIAHMLDVPSWRAGEFALYTLLFAIAAISIVSIPHRSNRRYGVVLVAIVAVSVLSTRPSSAFGPAILLMVLGSRVTFAFGFRGAAMAWMCGVLFLVVSAYAQYGLNHGSARLVQAFFYVYGYSLLLALIFGVLGVTWLYSAKASANAAGAERVRIALDIHDSIGHGLTTLAVQLQNADRFRESQPQKSAEYLKRAIETSEHLLGDVRETVAILHDELPNAPAPFAMMLQRLHTEFESASNASVDWSTRIVDEPSGRLAMAAYRVLQEGLTNVLRHARARRVDVRVVCDEETVAIHIGDDGDGFDSTSVHGHGLASMRTRVEAARGTMTVTSSPGHGTIVEARFPMERGT